MSSHPPESSRQRITALLTTRGIDDRAIDDARTVTVGMDIKSRPLESDAVLTDLPRLVDAGADAADLPGAVADLHIEGVLGEGGMGVVNLATQRSLGRQVAVKQVRHDQASDQASMVLLREGWATGVLEHPNIVPVHAMGRDENDDPLIVMKKISGTSWLDIIADPDTTPAGFDDADPLDVHLDILAQVCNAMHYAHSQHIVHRDLKPENVMVGEFGEVYVLDWGIAVSTDDDPSGRFASAKDVTEPVGTPAYMAPEMVDPDHAPIDTHTDVFLLGAMLYEALTARPPYTQDHLFQILFAAHACQPPSFEGHDVPPELQSICRRAMARDPRDRFPSARALRQALMGFRRHRQARRLTDQGQDRLQTLRTLLNDGGPTDERHLYKVFSEARFAFEQARQIVDDLPDAIDGLQTTLELMARRELDQDAPKAASLLIADLPRPNDELTQRLETLRQRLDAREENLAELQQIKHDTDVQVGQRARAQFAMLMAFFWAAISLVLSVLVEFDIIGLTHPRTFAHAVFLSLLVSAVIFLGRKTYFKNDLNRRMLYAAIVAFVCVTAHRGMAWLSDIPFRTAVSHEMLIYGMGVISAGVTLDRRLIWVGLPFLLGAIAGAAFPSLVLWLFVPVNLLAMLLVYLVWYRDADAPDLPADARASS